MPVNWNAFKSNLLSYFDSNLRSQSTIKNIPQIATTIATQYELAILQGGDMNYNNPVTTYNKFGLENGIRTAFDQGYSTPENIIPFLFGSEFSKGLIEFWTGAQLAFIVPPPPSISVTSNNVTNPGFAEPALNWNTKTESKTEFIDAMIDYFTKHLQTISGTTIGLVPQPAGPPIPTPFPWVGYV